MNAGILGFLMKFCVKSSFGGWRGCFKQDLVVHFRAYMRLHILLICRTISGHRHILQEPGIVN
jgi:hypothetical protein